MDGVTLVSAFPVRLHNSRAYMIKQGMPEFDAGDIVNLKAQTTDWLYPGLRVEAVQTTTIRGMGRDVMSLIGTQGKGKLQRSLSQYSGYQVDLDETVTFYTLSFPDTESEEGKPCGCGDKTSQVEEEAGPEENSFVSDEVSVVVSNMEQEVEHADEEDVIWDDEDDEIDLEEVVEDRFKDLIDPEDF